MKNQINLKLSDLLKTYFPLKLGEKYIECVSLTYTYKNDPKNKKKINIHLRHFIALIVGITVGMLTYYLMYILFGYGGGQLAN